MVSKEGLSTIKCHLTIQQKLYSCDSCMRVQRVGRERLKQPMMTA